ncbi:12440_t:CDS:1 [Acaulospora colombiana]|uniref:12440_t:CDS:1 n=1 Tax=Acaulospora colombiana TaxID=27376 RepID=A0ACA9KL91_9GLOM|nr:12440_t:CDS:1 [Acaulospora colombiana]
MDIYAKTFKLEVKGDYVILAQVRHHSQELLEKLSNVTCFLDYSISKKVSLEIFGQVSDVLTCKKSTFGKSFLEKGERHAFFIGSPNDYSVYPKDGSPGDLLIGKLNIVNVIRVDGGQYGANLVIPPAPIKPKDPALPNGDGEKEGAVKGELDGKSEKTKEEKLADELAEAIRDLQISHLKKFPADSKARANILEELENNHLDHLPLFTTKLEMLLGSDSKKDVSSKGGEITPEAASSICEAADELLKNIDLTALAQYYGVKHDTAANEAADKKKKENEEKKKAVVLAYRAKAQALAVLADVTSDSESVNEFAVEFEKTWKVLAQWLDSTPPTSDFKSLLVYITRERRAKRFGNAIKALNKYIGEVGLNNDTVKDYEKALDMRVELFRDSEWDIWEKYESKWKHIRIPPDGYAPF